MSQAPNIKKLEAWVKQHVPMIEYAKLKVAVLDAKQCQVIIPFETQNKNHLQSFYFGSLAIGADAAAGLLAFYYAENSGHQVNILFKDFQAKFLRRGLNDVCFTCTDAAKVEQAIAKTIATGERVNIPVDVIASEVGKPNEAIAAFVMTLSMKVVS